MCSLGWIQNMLQIASTDYIQHLNKNIFVVKLREYNTKAENFRGRVEVGILIDF